MSADSAPFDPCRRRILTGAALAAGLALIGPYAGASGIDYPFTLGVASGDPWADGFVIWTRLAPRLGFDAQTTLPGPVPVRWTVTSDDAMQHVVRQGEVVADVRFAHSVHVEVEGLLPGRPYWYRFEALGAQSPIGRSRTAPAAHSLAPAHFGFVSCSNWELGYFSAYRHLAAEQPDLVFFLGDYIYESSLAPGSEKILRAHNVAEAEDLAGYRNRYAQYRSDPDLQALHACAPCVVTWDDHEVQNDYANRWSQDPSVSPTAYLRRRAAAYQAFYEHMPLRRSSLPHGPDMRVYRHLDFGRLVRFHVLDGRQYRTEQPCIPSNGSRRGHVADPTCPDLMDPKRTMLGWQQEAWLHQSLAQSQGYWNIIAQDLLVTPLLQRVPNSQSFGHWTDGWDGYEATRQRVLQSIEQTRARNPVFWGGDIHSFWTTDLHLNSQDIESKIVATEFVGTSVTSDGPPFDTFSAILPFNPHVKFFDSRQRGYVSVTLDERQMQTRFRVISDRRDPFATVSNLAQFVVEDGKAGAQQI